MDDNQIKWKLVGKSVLKFELGVSLSALLTDKKCDFLSRISLLFLVLVTCKIKEWELSNVAGRKIYWPSFNNAQIITVQSIMLSSMQISIHKKPNY